MPKPAEPTPTEVAATESLWKGNAARAGMGFGCSTCGAEAAYAIHAYDEGTQAAGLVRLACEKHRTHP